MALIVHFPVLLQMFAQCQDLTIHVSLFAAAGRTTHYDALTRLMVCLYSFEIWDNGSSFSKKNKNFGDCSC
jgi:hypothetical protein